MRHSERNWYVLPKPRKMLWTPYENTEIDIEVLAFAFEDDTPVWLTVNGTVVNSTETTNRDWDE